MKEEVEDEPYLISRCRAGDADAFYKLVKPFMNRVYSAAYAILRSPHLAEDAVQNAMLEAYRSIMNGKQIRSFGPWFKKVAAMRAMDLARERSRRLKKTGEMKQGELADQRQQPLDAVVKKEAEEQLLQQVLSLNKRHRCVIVLYYYHEMTVEEIAEILGVKAGTVKSRLYHARMKLLKLNQNTDSKQVIFNV
ncbi:RNA polymerase subunit sigma-24 [Paenibacillus sp. PK3_47]|uniref:RNA polymerase sigma factor n=1 Tax=Paenibacillus sp. PK3_47 TaxID=2072642 RepID=UPI00201E0429|nr:sigma-70 family RNA polymerase sigma factor [Paenibacillus sp. PK3_47]UQZ36938.1 RNA polymerase subunit sigma-24 [Paenibacillus sp. PK3_47]